MSLREITDEPQSCWQTFTPFRFFSTQETDWTLSRNRYEELTAVRLIQDQEKYWVPDTSAPEGRFQENQNMRKVIRTTVIKFCIHPVKLTSSLYTSRLHYIYVDYFVIYVCQSPSTTHGSRRTHELPCSTPPTTPLDQGFNHPQTDSLGVCVTTYL